jgi:MFS family permease
MQLYVVQFICGISAAAAFPPFMALFTKHIDKHKEGSEWGIYYTLTDLCAAGAAVIGGVMAVSFGFRTLIMMVVFVGVIGALFLLPIRLFIRQNAPSK